MKVGIRIGLVLSLFLFLCLSSVQGQQFFGQVYQHVHDEKCAAVPMEKHIEEQVGVYGSRDYFEAWMGDQITERRKSPSIMRSQEQETRVIPVVVHVVHNGEDIGVGNNIPEIQILNQIRIINEDFRRQNPDASNTPAEFRDIAADSNIEFVLAKQDPEGLPTSGIIRVQGTKNTYTAITDAALLSQFSYWPAEDYLNIWVAPIAGNVLGWASPPLANLPGLGAIVFPREIDGVFVTSNWFGEGGNANSSARGRTLTHEIGHFFGLRHIWGDGNCDVDDFVDDTPNQNGPNFVCRIDAPRFTCESRDMTENYMDYTTDACMNIFTQGQVERFNVVLANSPRRASLVNGRATREPPLLPNNLSIDRLINPSDLICDLNVIPEVLLRNRGENTITSATLEVRLNGNLLEERSLTLNLELGDTTRVLFSPIQLAGEGDEFEVNILEVNGELNPETVSRSIISNPVIQPTISLPYRFAFEEFDNLWKVRNPDDSLTWELGEVTLDGNLQQVIQIRNYEYEAFNQLDFLISPQINLSEFPNAQLTFRMAYGPYNAQGFGDDLIVAISDDCGNTFQLTSPPYEKDVQFLQTSSPTLDPFVPSRENQFRREIVNLAPFADMGNIRIAIINRNGYGNNLYIKDIEILPEEVHRYRVDLVELVSPTPISVGDHEQETIRAVNTGNLPVDGFIFRRRLGNATPVSYIGRGIGLQPGDSLNINLPRGTIGSDLSRLTYTVDFPNFDQNPGNSDEISRFILTNSNTERIPFRQNFNNTVTLAPWVVVNPQGNNNNWELTPLQTGGSGANLVRLDDSQDDNSYWLGSPLFDLSAARQAALFFDFASGQVVENTILKVLASRNGGRTYQEVFRKTGAELNTSNSSEANPNQRGDFERQFVNLTDYAGNERAIRVAIVLENTDEANSTAYIDNIELFLSANPEPVDPGLGNTIIYPNPARDVFNIVFNLQTFESVNIQITSPTGQIVHDVDYPNTLNQTYTFSSQLFSKGLFIVKITSNTITETRKLIIH
ncbi:T9SS-dependent choice-of-anchor J family protein [Arthrospiribacter ruber]|uniref:T9SS C-terminal target domain-containing protein n=1 Tax=Arthrospiribacter ruber TaxID=2487934 RepID=A0A951IY45_9BACT|nr:choice-of-anchor J domain-containing protein [Arthrospiribacter ruber]MBW3468197.1 T9SS C-terminal target domain-containing protein [Arthrospiribacter ruber]